MLLNAPVRKKLRGFRNNHHFPIKLQSPHVLA